WRIAAIALQTRAVRCAAVQLDDHATGDVGQRQARLGVLPDGRAAIHADAGADLARVVGLEPQVGDVAYLDAAVFHRAAARQAAHRLVEADFVVAVLTIHAGLAEPQREQQRAADRQYGEESDQDVMGTGFHQNLSCFCAACAARQGGPWKYSRIQGSSVAATASSVSTASTRFCASTATRSQMA